MHVFSQLCTWAPRRGMYSRFSNRYRAFFHAQRRVEWLYSRLSIWKLDSKDHFFLTFRVVGVESSLNVDHGICLAAGTATHRVHTRVLHSRVLQYLNAPCHAFAPLVSACIHFWISIYIGT
jgi:hypothetical protein